jgi:hypothetical protein
MMIAFGPTLSCVHVEIGIHLKTKYTVMYLYLKNPS